MQTEDQNDCKKNTTTVSGLPLPATIAGALANASAQGAAAIAATIATIQISTAAAASAGHYA